jgi:hypothetical protein
MNRGRIHRTMKLGEAAMAKIEGTSLDTAGEQDELLRLNRGMAPGEHTAEVAKLIEDAHAGKDVSAIAYVAEITGRKPKSALVVVGGTDFDAEAHEHADKDARIAELENKVWQLERENGALRSEIEELKAMLDPHLTLDLTASSDSEIEAMPDQPDRQTVKPVPAGPSAAPAEMAAKGDASKLGTLLTDTKGRGWSRERWAQHRAKKRGRKTELTPNPVSENEVTQH